MEDYDKISEIGRGAFGKVFLCRRWSDNRMLVVKQITETINEGDSKAVEKEVSILSSLRHPHIVHYFDSFTDADGRLSIVMEYARGGSLDALVEKRLALQMPFTQGVVEAMIAQLCQALQYVHKKHIVHGDLCARNVLICGPSDNHLLLKICDFGVSKLLESSLSSSSSNGKLKGSLECLSPEQCMGLPATTSSDIWALGCLLYLLITFKLPFSYHVAALARQVTSDVRDMICSHGAIDATIYDQRIVQLMLSMLTQDDSQRPSATDLLKSPLLLPHTYMLYCNLFSFELIQEYTSQVV